MAIINIHDAKTHFSRIVDEVAAGAEVIIAKAGKPVVRIVPLADAVRPNRRLGILANEAVVPADFDDPLPDDILDRFEGRGG
jgi:prevent-host-death family protein